MKSQVKPSRVAQPLIVPSPPALRLSETALRFPVAARRELTHVSDNCATDVATCKVIASPSRFDTLGATKLHLRFITGMAAEMQLELQKLP